MRQSRMWTTSAATKQGRGGELNQLDGTVKLGKILKDKISELLGDDAARESRAIKIPFSLGNFGDFRVFTSPSC